MSTLFWFYFTYPGLAFHEWSHYVMCRTFGVPVVEVSFWNGYVKHGKPQRVASRFFVAIAPFLSNTITGSLLVSASLISELPWSWQLVFGYFGLTLLLHALPSEHDWGHARPRGLMWLHPFYVLSSPAIIFLTVLYALPKYYRRILFTSVTVAIIFISTFYYDEALRLTDQLVQYWDVEFRAPAPFVPDGAF